eukprot:TRINITY_DN1993_c0_g1_i16.p1 TRINITY_DN1993_c0_g1~~TRINITY_DN1993_c0_g1_i16.p1  ORF type:complete len:251 (-),score=18.08 TRINITY_DN1993_c0_g1_i16:32-751(-)
MGNLIGGTAQPTSGRRGTIAQPTVRPKIETEVEEAEKKFVPSFEEPLWITKGPRSFFNERAHLPEYGYKDPPASQSGVYEKGKHWTIDPREEWKVKVAKDGIGAAEPLTLIDVMKSAVRAFPTHMAMSIERPTGEKSTWTWLEYWNEVRTAARALIKLGLPRHGCVNILGFNAPEWHMAHLATICAGGLSAGIYATNGREACKYITEHSEASILVVENKEIGRAVQQECRDRSRMPSSA